MLGDTDVKTLGAFEAVVAKAKECAPCVFLLRHVEVFGRKANAQEHGTGEISLYAALYENPVQSLNC
jgi:hypothetical protein